MVTTRQILSFCSTALLIGVDAQGPPAQASYQAPAQFPTSIFSEYYYGPSPSQEPQPKIKDPVYNFTFPLNLTNPLTLPTNDTDPAILPTPVPGADKTSPQQAYQNAINQISGIVEAKNGTNCTKCVDSLLVLQNLSMTAPAEVPNAMVNLCNKYKLHSNATCIEDFGLYTLGSIWTQIIRYGDIKGLDGRYMCHSISTTTCPTPVVDPPLDVAKLFPKPKPKNATAPPASGKRVKVAHLSDLHLDPRYLVGAEANCSDYLCCRKNMYAAGQTAANASVEMPAPLHGAYMCDSPYFLAASALEAVHPLTGTSPAKSAQRKNGSTDSDVLGWTIYTGDLVSHDDQDQLSREYAEYTETSVYHMMQSLISGPIFPVLGNHDTNPEAQDAPHSLPGSLSTQMSWNYDHVAALWQNDFRLPSYGAEQARTHYGGYSVKNEYGLRMIGLNMDFVYRSNLFNLQNVSSHDNSGMFSWLIGELQAAEDRHERVWILGHVLTGWDGSNPLPNPTDLFYQIVDRYSPHVIANMFFGHTHEDQQMIYYANNGTTRNTSAGVHDAQTLGWIGPSITPLTNLNSGFRMYEVDTGSFDVYDSYTWYANVSTFPSIQTDKYGPTFQYEYSTRDSYSPAVAGGWPKDAPLNATFWHKVTEGFESQAKAGNLSMTEKFNTYQGKSSVKSPACNTTACALAKVCYMRSGSVALGQMCPQGYGSVQSAFTPK